MPRRMQRHGHTVDRDALAIRETLKVDAGQPRQQHAGARLSRQIVPMTEAGMIGVRMRDDGAFDGPPWIDMEVARWTIKPFGARDDEVGVRVRVCVQPGSGWSRG